MNHAVYDSAYIGCVFHAQLLGDPSLGYRCLFPQQTCKEHLSRFGELSSADGEQDIEIFLGCHSGEANEDIGAPMPFARLVLAPTDDQISTINARPL